MLIPLIKFLSLKLYQKENIITIEKGEKMEIKILAATAPYKDGENKKEFFNKLSGEVAGICYMPSTIDTILNQPLEKKLKRAQTTKESGHHSVFDHEYVTLYLEDVPKMFAMLLNNEKVYTTSEKSARYTKMILEGNELNLFEKWVGIFEKLIIQKYGNQPYFAGNRVQKLAQENARYFTSVFTPTSLAYTVSYRQLNYIYCWLKNIDKNSNEYLEALKPTAKAFCEKIEKEGLVDEKLAEFGEQRDFSLFAKKDRVEYFGDVYSTSYEGSFASLAQAQRHRTLNYEFRNLKEKNYYVPKIIENSPLKEMWLEDMRKVDAITPQGQLVQIYERGTPESFILKVRERLCTCAQLEIANQTKNTLEKYIEKTADGEIKSMLEKYNNGARCTSGYKCKNPCGFKEGIDLSREI